MPEKPNEITFCLDDYKDEFGDPSPSRLWRDISDVLRILLQNGYTAQISCEDGAVYVIRFDYDDESMGTPYPYWMTPDEFEKRFGEGEEDG